MTAGSEADNIGRSRDRVAHSERTRAVRAAQRVRESNREVRATFASPQAYDESGFPITAKPSSFADRVRRLLVG